MHVQVHDHLIANGYTAAPEVGGAVYWAGRVLRNLKGISKYATASRALAEIIWEDIRVAPTPENPVHGSLSYAINPRGIQRLKAWEDRYASRLSGKQQMDARELVDAIEKLTQLPA